MKIKRRTDIEIDPVFAVGGDAGRDGLDGQNGVDGRDGVDGRAGVDGVDGRSFNPRGEYRSGRVYLPLDVVTDDGSSFLCVAETKSSPPGKAWQLLAAKGDPGERGEAGLSQRGRPGKDAVADTPAVADQAMLVGSVVYASGAGRVDLAQSDNGETATAIGLVTSVNGSAVAYRTSGVVTNPNWSLTPKAVYYLSPDTPGGVTTDYPTEAGLFVVIIGTAISPTQLALNINWVLEQS